MPAAEQSKIPPVACCNNSISCLAAWADQCIWGMTLAVAGTCHCHRDASASGSDETFEQIHY